MPTDFAQQAQVLLRDPSQFQWYVIPLLAIVTYIYATEMFNKNWNSVFAGLAFWAADSINEILNSVFFHLNGRAPLWATPADTAYLILIGLNIEIMFMFAIAGIAWSKMLSPDPAARIMGIPNRWFIALTGSAFCVLVEILLNRIDALTWDWPWWSATAPWLIYTVGYLWFFMIAFWVHDLNNIGRQGRAVAALWGAVVVMIAIFGAWLGWL
jgi:hypothetical protein